MMKIVIPGGSGHAGRILARYFHERGDEVAVLSRAPVPSPWRIIAWDGISPGPWTAELEGADVCVNLAGRSVNCRYHEANRREIFNSRVRTTKLLQSVIVSLRHPPRVWLNASTATIYRHALDRPMDDHTGELGGSEPGAPATWHFSIEVAKSWEAAFFDNPAPRTRKITMRSAMIFGPGRGGVFEAFRSLARRGLGGALGSGAQYVSWIHARDFVRAVEFLIARDSLEGAINLASPNPLPNRDFMRALREALGVRFGIPSPAWLLEIGAIFIRTETELILKSRRVIPTRLLEAGFTFDFPHWPAAARDLAAMALNP